MSALDKGESPMVCACGLTMSRNPHPDAGKPSEMNDVGTVWVCIPCTVGNRRRWSDRARRAEGALSEARSILSYADHNDEAVSRASDVMRAVLDD